LPWQQRRFAQLVVSRGKATLAALAVDSSSACDAYLVLVSSARSSTRAPPSPNDEGGGGVARSCYREPDLEAADGLMVLQKRSAPARIRATITALFRRPFGGSVVVSKASST
jgi:hypothetical protein